MAALSIASVTAQAREDVSEYLTLILDRKEGRLKWVYNDKKAYDEERCPPGKIRDLKMDQWLDVARILVKRVQGAIASGEVRKPPAKVDQSIDPSAPKEPMPSFMIVKQPILVPLQPTEEQGYQDACRGITANPFGCEEARARWDRGHDRAFDEGVAPKPRFGRTAGKRN